MVPAIILCTTPPPFLLGGGVDPPTEFLKRGAWHDLKFLREGCWEKGGDFFQGGCSFYIKDKLKGNNTTHWNATHNISCYLSNGDVTDLMARLGWYPGALSYLLKKSNIGCKISGSARYLCVARLCESRKRQLAISIFVKIFSDGPLRAKVSILSMAGLFRTSGSWQHSNSLKL